MDKYTHGTIRNTFSKLRKRGLIKLYCRSSAAFYVLSSGKPKRPPEKVTLYQMVGKGGVRGVKIDFGVFLDGLDWEDVCRVHDVTLCFGVGGLYGLCLRGSIGRLIPESMDV
jgi:hypothetical protein